MQEEKEQRGEQKNLPKGILDMLVPEMVYQNELRLGMRRKMKDKEEEEEEEQAETPVAAAARVRAGAGAGAADVLLQIVIL